MNTIEYIILAVITILALVLIIRMIIKIAKGENPCFCCKSCGDDEKSSCDVPAESSDKQEDESENKED